MQKVIKRFAGPLIIGAYFLMFLASKPMSKTRTAPVAPGWYGITTGWNNWTSDIDGKVGYQLYVSAPQGRCEPSRSWSGDHMIVSGSLPPGLTLNSSNSSISGIPKERGHWIVKLRMTNIQCGGKYYKDFEQELRFHITGTGVVRE